MRQPGRKTEGFLNSAERGFFKKAGNHLAHFPPRKFAVEGNVAGSCGTTPKKCSIKTPTRPSRQLKSSQLNAQG
jgi:hypothetical protein